MILAAPDSWTARDEICFTAEFNEVTII